MNTYIIPFFLFRCVYCILRNKYIDKMSLSH